MSGVVAATNRRLDLAIREGAFREDLFYRINVVPIFLPPLRERKEDIPDLVDFFISRFAQDYSQPQRDNFAGSVQAADGL